MVAWQKFHRHGYQAARGGHVAVISRNYGLPPEERWTLDVGRGSTTDDAIEHNRESMTFPTAALAKQQGAHLLDKLAPRCTGTRDGPRGGSCPHPAVDGFHLCRYHYRGGRKGLITPPPTPEEQARAASVARRIAERLREAP